MWLRTPSWRCSAHSGRDRSSSVVVLDVWKAREADAASQAETLSRRAADIRSRREKLVEAFVYQRALDRATFDPMLSKLEAELAAVEGARAEAQLTEVDAAGLVDYAVHVVMNAGTL